MIEVGRNLGKDWQNWSEKEEEEEQMRWVSWVKFVVGGNRCHRTNWKSWR